MFLHIDIENDMNCNSDLNFWKSFYLIDKHTTTFYLLIEV